METPEHCVKSVQSWQQRYQKEDNDVRSRASTHRFHTFSFYKKQGEQTTRVTGRIINVEKMLAPTQYDQQKIVTTKN